MKGHVVHTLWSERAGDDYSQRCISFYSAGVGPVIARTATQGRVFADDISRLIATGGGDCREYAYEAMYDAMTEPADAVPGSPLFVFTDAPSKVRSEKDDEAVAQMARSLGVSITFFVGNLCGSNEAYNSIAHSTNGHVFNLPHQNIRNMSG